ncbi:hypothetical protein Acr_00g0074990 [Actinidia rufa]|uniref:Uncharacterized protein n=1 Tax=Actinidia rufa TaxID=165716 RepID=A0A7J0DSJ0_9ERIC|nr:hypothetical protein Acr_00g0074990 [Actinidia rufa]
MPPRQARGRERSLTRVRGARGARRARGIREEGDGENHQESVMGGGARGNVEVLEVLHLQYWVVQNSCKGCSLPLNKWHFMSTEEEKAKQFMRGLRPSIRNKIAGNLIKVYSTMVSAAVAIEETLNETRKITNPKSQLWPSWTYDASMQTEGEQSGSYGITTTYSVSSGIEGHSSIYRSTDFILVQTTGYSSAELEDAETCLCYDISSRTVGITGQ